MSTGTGILSRLVRALGATLQPSRARTRGTASERPAPRGEDRVRAARSAGQGQTRDASTRTVEITPPPAGGLHIAYAPRHDGDPDAGEIVWTWVPYQEDASQGKDRPVLVIGRHDADRVYAVKLTSKDHDGQRDFLPIGSGSWDSQDRDSWVDIDQVYLVHKDGMRREAAALDGRRFAHVAAALHSRFGWALGE